MSPKADHGEESYKLKGRMALITGREFKYAFETNFYAMFYLCKPALAHLQPGSSFINVASIQAYQPSPNLLAYGATKGQDSTYITGGVLGVTGGRPLS
jgi:NAD(P)-dependent dehydrogenase (short-subunit alcohol dehydrogenase family)